MEIKLVTSDPDLTEIRNLFIEYQISLKIDLCFQNFDTELSNLPGEYVPPRGRLYLAKINEKSAGCIALHSFDTNRCEMKRLYVQPTYRGQGISKLLASKLINDAKETGYHTMLLDTLSPMTAAISLYHSLGFREIEPYRYNPIPGAMYMELKLNQTD
jgi:putative acetyltransferase